MIPKSSRKATASSQIWEARSVLEVSLFGLDKKPADEAKKPFRDKKLLIKRLLRE
jgi:hypothetical protein